MAPTYRINSPDVLATLPRPLDHSTGQYHAGEVYTQQAGSKKRKRLEVAVGVDGEAANIYHVPSSDLRTSYPIPPQESFTSPPYSIRYQNPKSTDREQYTYFSTQNGAESKITLCKDSIRSTGRTASTSKSHRIQHKSPVQRLYTSNHLISGPDNAPYGDLLAVCKDGHILCFDGADLEERWGVSAFGLCKDMLPSPASALSVEEVFHVTAEEALKGIFQGRQDAFGAFGRAIDPDTFNPDVFIFVARVAGPLDSVSRCLIILGAAPREDATKASTQQTLVQLHVAPLPAHSGSAADLSYQYQLHPRSGRLLELSDGTMRTYDLTSAVPKLRDTVTVPEGSCSFVQLSEHSVLSASPASLTVTNVTYRSVQAQAATFPDDQLPSSEGAASDSDLTLLTYFSKLDLVIAVANNTLYSVQVQRHKSSSKEGLLIDAIGCGLSKAEHLPDHMAQRPRPPFNRLLPGTLSDHYVKQSLVDVENLDTALTHNNLKEFERLLAAKFQVTIESSDDEAKASDDSVTPDWQWLSASFYPAVDRRWVLYSISRVFSIELGDDDSGRPTFDCILPESNVLVYLVVAGHLTVSNVLAAFRSELSDVRISRNALAEGIVQQLIDVDPALELLLSYLTATKLGEVELLLIIRTIIRSLDQQPRLALGKPSVSEEEDYVTMEIDQLERELEKAEYNLGDESNTRARLLTAAFERLAGYSSVATVRAMRVTLSPLEILSLIHLFRIQLVGSAWTTRYSEITGLDQDESIKTMPDGAIALIAELLARCIDAVGTNGWLTSGSAGDQLDGGHFLTALKLEVNAALEGLNDVVALNGILGEAIRFGRASLGTGSGRAVARTTDRPRHLEVGGSAELPLGLTPKQAVSQYKVVSGGEVVERSAREKGHLLSQRVKEYSLERISI